MISHPTIAVIGGTGKSGQYLVRELIQRQISFRSLQGDVRDPDAVRPLLAGCHAVISMLGQRKGEPTVFSQATRTVLAGMAEWGIRRYIVITGLNVDTPLDKKGAAVQAGTDWMKKHYPETTADKQLEYSLLCASRADWTLVRLPLIGLTEETGSIQTSLEDCPGEGIRAGDLARFLVEQLWDERSIRQAPFLANV